METHWDLGKNILEMGGRHELDEKGKGLVKKIHPLLLAELLAVPNKKVPIDTDYIETMAEVIATTIAEIHHLPVDHRYLKRTPAHQAKEINEIATSMEKYLAAVDALGWSTHAQILKYKSELTQALERQGRYINDPIVSEILYDIPDRLNRLIPIVRGIAAEAKKQKTIRGGGRPANQRVRQIAFQAGSFYMNVTNKVPYFGKGTHPGPFVLLMKRIFEIGKLRANPLYYAQYAISAYRPSKRGRKFAE